MKTVTLQNAGIWDFEDVVLNGMAHKPSDGCVVLTGEAERVTRTS
jgi:hypothetical protein